MTVRPLTSADDLSLLVLEGEAQGHRFLRRLVDEMTGGQNRFDQAGEAIVVAEDEGRVLGVCGLNRDPYSGRAKTSRLRHLFVDPSSRGKGVGSALVRACLEVAQEHSDLIVLRTFCPEASAFYSHLGFVESRLPEATHEKSL